MGLGRCQSHTNRHPHRSEERESGGLHPRGRTVQGQGRVGQQPHPDPRDSACGHFPPVLLRRSRPGSSAPTGTFTKKRCHSRVTISGLAPSQWHFTWFFFTPMPTAWQLASDSGTIVATVPTGLPTGSHRVVVQDSAGAVYGWADLTVQSELPHAVPADSVTPASSMVPQNVPAPSAQPGGALPQTGIDVSMLLATAVSLLLTGLIAAGFILSRRRRHETRT